jgi:hypothetical protein
MKKTEMLLKRLIAKLSTRTPQIYDTDGLPVDASTEYPNLDMEFNPKFLKLLLGTDDKG